MSFRKGDKVKFLNDVGQGTIVRFQNDNLAVVLNDDGFEVPVLISELLKMEGDYSTENTNNNASSGSEVIINQNIISEANEDLNEDGLNTDKIANVLFALVPTNQKDVVNSDLNVYLINDSNFRTLYTITKAEGQLQALFAYGNLEDNTKVHIGVIKRDELNEFEEINFQLLFFRKGNYNLLNPINKKWNVKPTRFYKQTSFTVNDFFHEDAFIYELTSEEMNLADHISDSDIEKAKKEKERKEPVKQFKSSKQGKDVEIEEVDLHIHELVDNHEGLSNTEILDMQLGRFTTALDGGIISGTRRMVFIHGIGNGRLKREVAKKLDRNYPKLKYQDASFKEYGYGATMVIIK